MSRKEQAFVPIEPLGERLLVRVVETATTTPGGLHLPGNVRKRAQRAVIVALGPGKLLDSGEYRPLSPQYQVGRTVLLADYIRGVVASPPGAAEELLVVGEGDVAAVLADQ